jgi:phosphoglycolate phosphatase-like HAD superfamily hydrolase
MGENTPDFVALDWNGTVVPVFGRPPYAGAVETIDHFRRLGIPLFVVSHATQQEIAEDVERTGLQFDGVIGCMEKAGVLSDLRAQHGFGLMLGDHPADYRAALEAGVPFVQARLQGQALFGGCRDSFEDWAEVPNLLLAASRLDG